MNCFNWKDREIANCYRSKKTKDSSKQWLFPRIVDKIARSQNMVINCAITDDRHLWSGLKICVVICVNILQSTCPQLTGVLYPWIQNKMLWKQDNQQRWQLLRFYCGLCTVNIWSPDPNTNVKPQISGQQIYLSINVWQHFAIFW